MKSQSHSHLHSENNYIRKREHPHLQADISAEVLLLLFQATAKFLLALEKNIHEGNLFLV